MRQQQFVTFILWALAGILLFQHWSILLLGMPILPLTYIDLIRADQATIEKLGEDYKIYMRKVQRTNFLLGIIRQL